MNASVSFSNSEAKQIAVLNEGSRFVLSSFGAYTDVLAEQNTVSLREPRHPKFIEINGKANRSLKV